MWWRGGGGARWGAELYHNRGPCWASRPGASPEGTARLEEPSAGPQLNKRWGDVSAWKAACAGKPHVEDKQMLDETGGTEGKKNS